MNKNMTDILLVGFDEHSGDIPVLIVGRKERKNNGEYINVINAFKDKEALELYKKLIEKR